MPEANRGRASFGSHRNQLPTTRFAQCTHQSVRSFGLNYGQFWKARNQAEVIHFDQGLADGATVPKIASRDKDVIGRLPVQLFHQFDCESLLAFEAKWVDGI